MPITAVPDKNNPGSFIWVDQATGEPALQPGGPGTPYVAKSDMPASSAPKSPSAQTPANLASEQLRILEAYDRRGWRVVGRTDAVANQSVTDPQSGQVTSVRGPTGNEVWAIVGPNGEPDTLEVRPPLEPGGQYEVAESPKALAKPPSASASVVSGPNDTSWEKDANGKWVDTGIPGKVSNPDVDRSLALDAQAKQGDIDRRRNNAAAGRGYLTDAEVTTFDYEGRRLGQSQQTIDQNKKEFAHKKEQEDRLLQPKIDAILASTGNTNAQTTLAGKQASQVESATDIAGRKAGPEIEEIQARADASRASAANQRLQTTISGAPDIVPNVGTGPYIYSKDPSSGALSTTISQNYQPKTQAEIVARVGQLTSLAQQKRTELQSKISGSYTAQQAQDDWTTWWQQNIEPQKGALAAAQDEAQFARAGAEEERRRAALATAQTAGTQAITATNAQAERRVGAGFGAAADQLMKGAPLSSVNFKDAFTYKADDLTQVAANATNEALKHISPSAAAATGNAMPNYGAYNPAEQLDRLNYTFGGAAPGGPPMGGPPAGVPPMSGAPMPPAPPQPPMPLDWAALMQRQIADRSLQRQQSTYAYPG